MSQLDNMTISRLVNVPIRKCDNLKIQYSSVLMQLLTSSASVNKECLSQQRVPQSKDN